MLTHEILDEYWPFNAAGILHPLFDAEILHSAFFVSGREEWETSDVVIRRGVKSLIKRSGRRPPKVSIDAAGDRQLILWACNDAKIRDSMRDLVLEAVIPSGRMPGGHVRGFMSVKLSLPEILWRCLYMRRREFDYLTRWLRDIGIPRPDIGAGYYLTAEVLSKAVPPVEVDVSSRDVSRAILLFAALLPRVEMTPLISVAISLGCSELAPSVDKGNAKRGVQSPGAWSESEVHQGGLGPIASVIRDQVHEVPRLIVRPRSSLDYTYVTSAKVIEKLTALDLAWNERISTLASLSDHLGATLLMLVDLPELEVQRRWSELSKAREAVERWKQSSQDAKDIIWKHLEDIDKTVVSWVSWTYKPSTLDELKDALLSIDEAHQLLTGSAAATYRTADPKIYVARRADLEEMRQEARTLAENEKHRQELNRDKIEFLTNARAFVARKEPDPTVATWLSELNALELEALFHEVSAEWPVPRAYLARLAVEQASSSFAQSFEAALKAAKGVQERRALMYFVDPASSAFDQFSAARRMIVLEHFRDIMDLQPLASLSDPSSGLSDGDLVGGNLMSLIHLIEAHLELVRTGADLRNLVAEQGSRPEQAQEFIRFCTSPSMMSGIYFRLREAARAKYFASLIDRQSIDVIRARKLHADFDIDEAVEEVVAEVQTPQDRIEGRHALQLFRYLAEGRDLLDAFLATVSVERTPREAEFRASVREICSNLSDDPLAEQGSIQWLEREANAILHESVRHSESGTLQGTGRIADRLWRREDTLWAQGSLKLPLFYGDETTQSTVSVIAEAIHWWGVGRLPESVDVALALSDKEEFGAALALLEPLDNEVEGIRKQIRGQFTASSAPIRAKLASLVEGFPLFLSKAVFHSEVLGALNAFDVARARESLELLEIELLEAAAVAKSSTPDPLVEERRHQLRQLLLMANVALDDTDSSLQRLEALWSRVLETRVGERCHVLSVSASLSAVMDRIPELATEFESFNQDGLRPERWLPEQVSREYASYLEATSRKLHSWIVTSEAFAPNARQSLVELVRWFLRFVQQQADNLGALGEGENADDIFEDVLERCYVVEQAHLPNVAVDGLEEAGEPFERLASPDARLLPLPRADGGAEQWIALREVFESGDWEVAERICRDLEVQGAEREQINEIRSFAYTAKRLGQGLLVELPALVSAARLLGLAGHPIQRALSSPYNLALAADLIRAASGGKQSSLAESVWAGISRPREFFRDLAASTHPATRVVEQLVSGGLGSEVVDSLWDAITNTADPGVSRRALLSFLYTNRSHPQIVRLAGRHDAGIKARLERLLEVRAVAVDRPDLIGVAQALTDQLAESAKPIFREFLRSLPVEARSAQPDIRLEFDNEVVLRERTNEDLQAFLQMAIEPSGVVPSLVEATLFPDDDVSFSGGGRRSVLTDKPVYSTREWPMEVHFGQSWVKSVSRDTFRIRFSAKALTGQLIVKDADFRVSRLVASASTSRRIDNDTLLDAYPGVTNTPAFGAAFHGREDELERLRAALVASRRPSPVLLTGMRRVGKTSLLLAFHEVYRQTGKEEALTVYLSLAERRAQLMSEQDVSAVFFGAVTYALTKRHFTATDYNRSIGERIQQIVGDRTKAKKAVSECYAPESLSDSLSALSEQLIEWSGGQSSRVVFLVDEAETLVLPYQAGGHKQRELEQFLQSLRELSQAASHVGIVLSGSNHISAFAQEYKNAFFGSCQQIDLEGIGDYETAARIVSPSQTKVFLDFHASAIRFAINSSAGMPQFMWQIGAATAAIVRGGPVTRSDVRRGISKIIDDGEDLPFKAYEVLEPIEHMLGMYGQREQDMLWLLLWRVANVTSLVAPHAQQHLIVDSTLLELDDQQSWKSRLLDLVALKILELRGVATYAFQVPIFGEGFRAAHHQQMYLVRQQRVAV